MDKKRRRYVYIGKRQKSWGRLVSVPDPEDQQQLSRGMDRNGRKRKRAGVRVRLFVGSEEPLLLDRNRANKRKKNGRGRGRGRKKKGLAKMNGQRQTQVASSAPHSQSSSLDVRDHGATDQNAALYEEPDPDHLVGDVDEGVWPGEYGHAHAHDESVAVVPSGVTVSGDATIPPDELERAIGAALACMQY